MRSVGGALGEAERGGRAPVDGAVGRVVGTQGRFLLVRGLGLGRRLALELGAALEGYVAAEEGDELLLQLLGREAV